MEKCTLYIYHMASSVTYQDISRELTQKSWRVMSSDEAGGDKTRQGFCVTERLIFGYNRSRRDVIFLNKNKVKQNGKHCSKINSSLTFKITFLCLLCLATASLDSQPNLISLQNVYIIVSCVA